MATLYLDRKGVGLELDGQCLLVCEPGLRKGRIPLVQLDRIVVQQRVALDSRLLGALAEHDVGLMVLDRRRPQRTFSMLGRPGNDVKRRRAQYLNSMDEDWCRHWSCLLVMYKVHAQYRLLSRARIERPDLRHPLSKGMSQLQRSITTLKRGLASGALSRDSIRGVEGSAAAGYFAAYQTLFPDSLGFTGRNRRPPRDPVNACLSLGYTLLHAEAVLAGHAAGLDPLQGFYHEPAFGRESLASDLIEPLRADIDGWVWALVRTRQLSHQHFFRQGQACLLNKAGRQVFYPAWEGHVHHVRSRLRAWFRRLTRVLLEDKRR